MKNVLCVFLPHWGRTRSVLRSVQVTWAPLQPFNELVIVTLWRSLLDCLLKFPPAIQRY